MQDVNANNIDPNKITGILDYLGLNPKKCRVAGLHLVENVQPHDDEQFARYEWIKQKAYFVVTEVSDSGKDKYKDSPEGSYFYHNRSFEQLFEGMVYPFNVTKEHAVMVKGVVKGFAIFVER